MKDSYLLIIAGCATMMVLPLMGAMCVPWVKRHPNFDPSKSVYNDCRYKLEPPKEAI